MTTQQLRDSLYTGVRGVEHSLPWQSWFEGHILAWHETEKKAWRAIKQARKIRETNGVLCSLGLLSEELDNDSR